MKFTPQQKQDIKQKLLSSMASNANQVVLVAPYKLQDAEVLNILSVFKEFNGMQPIVEVDESLLAGFKIIAGSRIVDCSLKTRINNLFK